MFDDSGDGKSKLSELLLSVIIAAITGLFITSSIGPAMVQPLLLDGSLISNGRFAFVYDAYDTIEDDDVPSIVGIGSSILMAGMNGTCMQEQSSIENARFYNMAMSGGKPYSEMLQIPALIESKPDIVMVEIGPNSLYGWDSTQYVNGITDYNEFRFQLMSMGMETNQIGDWYDVLDPVDKQWIETNRLGRIDAWSEYTRDAVEEYLTREIDDLTNALDEESYSYVPPVGTDKWDNYLSGPNWRTSKFDAKSLTEIREYLDEKMPSKSKQGVYNPKVNDTQNHKALDYIIHTLANASIDVVLVGIPHHPWVNEYLEPGQLDGMNLTYERYESLERVSSLQMYFEEWPSDAFSDRNHLDADGREVFCKRVTPLIDAVYFDNNISDVVIDSNIFKIPDKRGICEGSNLSFSFSEALIKIEAENYSSCTYGQQYIDRIWDKKVTFGNYSGQGYMTPLPDSKSNTGDSVDGPQLMYNLTNIDSGTYYLWIRMAALDGGGDSIHVGLNGIPFTYGGTGLSTLPNENWNWENIPVVVNTDNQTLLNIWMREDGVMIDSLILTSVEGFNPNISEDLETEIDCFGSNMTFSTDLNFTEDQGLIIIEAEDYSYCSYGTGVAENSFWESNSNFSGYTGQGFVEATPDNKIKTGESKYGPRLTYNISIPTAGDYQFWIRMAAPNGGGDSVHLAVNDDTLTSEEGILSTSPYNEWNWELISLNVTSVGFIQIDIWMREDGVMIDSLILTTDSNFIPN